MCIAGRLVLGCPCQQPHLHVNVLSAASAGKDSAPTRRRSPTVPKPDPPRSPSGRGFVAFCGVSANEAWPRYSFHGPESPRFGHRPVMFGTGPGRVWVDPVSRTSCDHPSVSARVRAKPGRGRASWGMRPHRAIRRADSLTHGAPMTVRALRQSSTIRVEVDECSGEPPVVQHLSRSTSTVAASWSILSPVSGESHGTGKEARPSGSRSM